MSENIALLSAFDVERLESLLARQGRIPEQAPHVVELAARLYAGDQAAPTDMPPDVVTMNSRVLLEELRSGKEFACSLMFPRDANSSLYAISILAPLGSALFGARVGTLLNVATPGGCYKYKVKKLLFQPEAAGRYDL